MKSHDTLIIHPHRVLIRTLKKGIVNDDPAVIKSVFNAVDPGHIKMKNVRRSAKFVIAVKSSTIYRLYVVRLSNKLRRFIPEVHVKNDKYTFNRLRKLIPKHV